MKKSSTLLLIISSILLTSLVLAACTTATSQSLPPVTITVTASAITTATATTTATVSVPAAPPVSALPTITPVAAPTTSAAPPDVNKNQQFFIGKDINKFVTPTVLSGVPNPSPVYQDNILDLDLGGYFTNRDAFYSPRIPGITDFDNWFYAFDLPVYRLPWVINWAYTTRSGSPDPGFSMSIYKKEEFNNLYNKSIGTLTISKLGVDRGVSEKGVHCLGFNEVGSFVVLVRANNADIASWWVKYGGQKYGQ